MKGTVVGSSFSHIVAAFGLALICALPGPARSQDVELYEVRRTEYFTQATTNRPATGTAMSHTINAFVVPAYDGSVASAAVHFPDGSSVEMTNMGSFFSFPSIPGQTVSLPGSARAGTY